MKRSRFSEEQIIGVLKEQEAGGVVADLCRKHGMPSATCLSVEGAVRRAGECRMRRARLKRLLANAMLDNAGLKDLFPRKSGRPTPDAARSPILRRPTV